MSVVFDGHDHVDADESLPYPKTWLCHYPLSTEPPMNRFVAAQLAVSHSYCVAAAECDFGFRPIVSMEEGLLRMQPDLNRLAGNSRRGCGCRMRQLSKLRRLDHIDINRPRS